MRVLYAIGASCVKWDARSPSDKPESEPQQPRFNPHKTRAYAPFQPLARTLINQRL